MQALGRRRRPVPWGGPEGTNKLPERKRKLVSHRKCGNEKLCFMSMGTLERKQRHQRAVAWVKDLGVQLEPTSESALAVTQLIF